MNEARNGGPHLKLVEDVIEVCIDDVEENMVSVLALRAHSLLDTTWNGWVRPVATAAAMTDFLARWRHKDPDGTWGETYERDGHLICTSADNEDDSFPRVGTAHSGEALYDLTGWVWVRIHASGPNEH